MSLYWDLLLGAFYFELSLKCVLYARDPSTFSSVHMEAAIHLFNA
jgi:hypothetical protein